MFIHYLKSTISAETDYYIQLFVVTYCTIFQLNTHTQTTCNGVNTPQDEEINRTLSHLLKSQKRHRNFNNELSRQTGTDSCATKTRKRSRNKQLLEQQFTSARNTPEHLSRPRTGS